MGLAQGIACQRQIRLYYFCLKEPVYESSLTQVTLKLKVTCNFVLNPRPTPLQEFQSPFVDNSLLITHLTL